MASGPTGGPVTVNNLILILESNVILVFYLFWCILFIIIIHYLVYFLVYLSLLYIQYFMLFYLYTIKVFINILN